jgi:hypothetical protein
MFKQFTDTQKLEMNRKARAIVRGYIAAGAIAGAFMAALPSQAHAYTDTFEAPNAQRDAFNKDWRSVIRHALTKSYKSYGKSTYDRFCEPEYKVCTDFIYYPVGNEKVFIREVTNANNIVVLRDVCTLNEPGDIRRCKNFDTGALRQDMKDKNNRWSTVEGSAF